MHTSQDPKVPFPAYFVTGARGKTQLRAYVAQHARLWLRMQRARGAKGAVMIDIDDTLIDGNENVVNGFEFMRELYDEASLSFPIHIVTARPDEEHANVMVMLRKRGFRVPPDRLHMLPTHLYNRSSRHVVDFKWKCFLKIAQTHGGVVARFGDKLWDVAHHSSLDTYLSHVSDGDTYIFLDPHMGGTYSAKLPGNDR